MAGGCIAMSDFNVECSDILKIGGVQGDGYVLNLKDANGDILQYTEDATGKTITDIAMQSGARAYKFAGEKYAHSWGHSLVKSELTKYFAQTAIIREIMGSAEDLVWFTEMATASALVLIFETNDQKFVVVGQYNGMTATEGDSFNSGNTSDADVTTSLNFSGEEVSAPYKYLDVGGYVATKAFLQGLLTAQP